jgi:hypothetical protein
VIVIVITTIRSSSSSLLVPAFSCNQGGGLTITIFRIRNDVFQDYD